MKIQNLYNAILVTLTVVLISSCTEGFDQVNVNPNQSTQEFVPPTTILASGFDVVGGVLYGSRLGIFYTGTYAGHTAPIGLGDYEYRININNNMWSNMYRAAGNFVDAKKLAMEDGNTNLAAVALAMKAFTAHHITDMWGAVPYSEAFQLLAEDPIRNPVYDSQQQVYNQILAELEEAADMLNNGTGDIGEGDLIYGGDVEQWKKFINSLRLRVAVRMSNVAENDAATVINKVLGNPGSYPIMADNSDNAYIWWPGLESDSERWFRRIGALGGNKTTQHRMNHELISTLKNTDDPRLPVYADPNENGEFNGYKMGPGQTTNPENKGANISHIGDRFGNDPDGFSPFMNVAEVKFILAEIYERGLYSGNAQDAYEAGIKLSMEENNITGTEVTDFLSEQEVAWDSGTSSNRHKIYLQKWVALFKNSVNAWSSVRRTDVPLITNVSADFASHDRPPFRMAYADEEQALNTNFPNQIHSQAEDTFYGFQLWWDTRSGIQ